VAMPRTFPIRAVLGRPKQSAIDVLIGAAGAFSLAYGYAAAQVEGPRVLLTIEGIGFGGADIQESKRIFARAAIDRCP
jgi:hypothetical protein